MEALQQALQATLSPQKAEREAAQKYLLDLRSAPDQITVLLRVVASRDGVGRELRQAAAIALKNAIRDHWEDKDDSPGLFAADKTVLRDNILGVMADETDNSVRNLLGECVFHAARYDYHAGHWPTLLPTLMAQLGTGEQLKMYNTVTAVRAIVKNFEHKPSDMREPLDVLVETVFPALLQLIQGALQFNTIEAGQMITLILKTFWHASQFVLPKCLSTDPAQMTPWFEVIIAVLRKPLPEASEGIEPVGQPIDKEEREKWPWWKAKKRATQISARMFERFGREKYTEEKFKPFARNFIASVACPLLEQMMQLLLLRSQGKFCSDQVMHGALMFLETAVQMSATYKPIKPHIDTLVQKIIFPTICLTAEELELWDTDPHEFVRQSGDIENEFVSPATMALNVLETLCRKRGKDALNRSLNFFTEMLNAYQLAPPEQRDYVQKDGTLYAIGALSDTLQKSNKYSPNLEVMLVSHVLPDFRAPRGFVRARAIWCLKRFADITFQVEQNVIAFTQGVIDALRDPELPVQCEAAATMRFVLKEQEGAKATLRSVLPQVIQEYFRLMSELGSDDVVDGLDAILEEFPEDIPPMAAQITQVLVSALNSYMTAAEDDDEAEMAAVKTFDALTTVLDKCTEEHHRVHLPACEQHLLPIVARVLDPQGDGMEFLDQACEILAYLTYYNRPLSPSLWQCFPLLVRAFEEFAYDYMNEMHPVFDNYISFGQDIFLSSTPSADGRTCLQMVTAMVRKVFMNDDSEEEIDPVSACNFAFSVLQQCTGRVDSWIQELIDLVLLKFNGGAASAGERPFPAAKSDKLKLVLVQLIANACLYNPSVAIAALEARGATGGVLTAWATMVEADGFARTSAKKLSVLGLISLMQLSVAAMPTVMTPMLPRLLQCILKLLGEIHHDDQEDAVEDDEEEDQEIESDGQDSDGFDEDEDCENMGDEAYMEFLESQQGKLAALLAGECSDYGGDDGPELESPLDDIDEFVFFAQHWQQALEREQAMQQLQAALPPEQQGLVQQLIQFAGQRQQEAASEQQQQAASPPVPPH